MSRTVFANASGLPNRQQVTTARDMSTLAIALMKNYPREYRPFATESLPRAAMIRAANTLMHAYQA